ncbi:hypothetical protein EZ458_24090, partial [Shigella sonnei]|nr:hypothetical protein [Shigella sonnei]
MSVSLTALCEHSCSTGGGGAIYFGQCVLSSHLLNMNSTLSFL